MGLAGLAPPLCMTGRSGRVVVIIGGGLLLESRVDDRLALVFAGVVRGGGSV